MLGIHNCVNSWCGCGKTAWCDARIDISKWIFIAIDVHFKPLPERFSMAGYGKFHLKIKKCVLINTTNLLGLPVFFSTSWLFVFCLWHLISQFGYDEVWIVMIFIAIFQLTKTNFLLVLENTTSFLSFEQLQKKSKFDCSQFSLALFGFTL